MLTEKDYCDLKVIKDLESLGMNVYTSFKGLDVLRSVSLYEAQKWLMKKYEIHVLPYMVNAEDVQYKIHIMGKKNTNYYHTIFNTLYDEDLKKGVNVVYCSYEEALLFGIKKAIEIIKTN